MLGINGIDSRRDFVKLDAAILIVTFLYYLLAQFRINEQNFSKGSYQSLWTFFTLENLMQIIFQVFLILSDMKQRKTCIVSLRSGAIVFIVGMSVLQSFLGMLSIWLILQVSICIGIHSFIFLRSLKMENDRYLLMPTVRRQ